MTKPQRTEAIVIDSFDYGESDRIVTLYTRIYGKIKGMAKGARRSRKRFQNTLESFSHVMVEVKGRGKGLYWLNYSVLLEGFEGIMEEVERFTYGNLLLEMVHTLTGEGYPVPGLFHLLLSYTRELSRTHRAGALTLLYAFRLLSILGYGPHLSRCVRCGRPSEPLFHLREGGLVCRDCGEGAVRVSPGLVRSIKVGLAFPLRAIPRITVSGDQMEEGFGLLEGFIEYHLQRRLKTFRFIEQMGGRRDAGKDLSGNHP